MAVPTDESEDGLGISDKEYEREAELGLADTEDEETGRYNIVFIDVARPYDELMMEKMERSRK